MSVLLLWAADLAWGTSLLYVQEPLVFAPPEAPPAERLDPLVVSPPMREWLQAHVDPTGTQDERMRRLVAALSRDLPFRYDPGYTGTAREVFEEGQYNCLGLTHLVVALGRELGVEVYYVRIEEYRTFYRSGPLVLASTHVAAGWGPPVNVQVIEIEQVSEQEVRAADRISDQNALALHYNNRGAELLLAGQVGLAREWLDRARQIDPDVPEAWVNTGVALRRSGRLDEAERAYRQAIALDADDLSAWRNLATLLDLRGDPNAAETLLEVADRRANDNPYTWVALGDLTARAGHAEDADRFYRRAGRLDPGNPEVLAARAELALILGDSERARILADRALRADPENERAKGIAARVR